METTPEQTQGAPAPTPAGDDTAFAPTIDANGNTVPAAEDNGPTATPPTQPGQPAATPPNPAPAQPAQPNGIDPIAQQRIDEATAQAAQYKKQLDALQAQGGQPPQQPGQQQQDPNELLIGNLPAHFAKAMQANPIPAGTVEGLRSDDNNVVMQSVQTLLGHGNALAVEAARQETAAAVLVMKQYVAQALEQFAPKFQEQISGQFTQQQTAQRNAQEFFAKHPDLNIPEAHAILPALTKEFMAKNGVSQYSAAVGDKVAEIARASLNPALLKKPNGGAPAPFVTGTGAARPPATAGNGAPPKSGDIGAFL